MTIHFCPLIVGDDLFKNMHVFVASQLDFGNLICLGMKPSTFEKYKVAQSIGEMWSINPGNNKHIQFTFFLAQ